MGAWRRRSGMAAARPGRHQGEARAVALTPDRGTGTFPSMRAGGLVFPVRHPALQPQRQHAWLAVWPAAAATFHAACGVASDSAVPSRVSDLAARRNRYATSSPWRAARLSPPASRRWVPTSWWPGRRATAPGPTSSPPPARMAGGRFSKSERVNRYPRTVEAADPPRLALTSVGGKPRAYIVWTSSVDEGYGVRLATAGPTRWTFDERPRGLAAGALRPAPGVAAGAGGAPLVVWQGGEGRRAARVGPASLQRTDESRRRPAGRWL